MEKPLKIIKNRSDIGAGTRGSDLGVDALEIAAINAENDFFNRYPFKDVDTHNESIYSKVNHTFAKRIHFVTEQCSRVASATKVALEDGFFPLVLSGDHSSALGTLAGIQEVYPDKTIGVIWIDAHADLHTPLSSPSGNVHGMPLAAALGHDNAEHTLNTIKKETKASWEMLKNLGLPRPIMRPEHLIYFGVRDTEAVEDAVMAACKIKNYTVHETRYREMKTCLVECDTKLSDVDLIYISFDVDSLDCDLISRGTGTPVEKGFDPEEVYEIITHFLSTGKACGLEICEINPLLDTRGNRMAETAFSMMNRIFKKAP